MNTDGHGFKGQEARKIIAQGKRDKVRAAPGNSYKHLPSPDRATETAKANGLFFQKNFCLQFPRLNAKSLATLAPDELPMTLRDVSASTLPGKSRQPGLSHSANASGGSGHDVIVGRDSRNATSLSSVSSSVLPVSWNNSMNGWAGLTTGSYIHTVSFSKTLPASVFVSRRLRIIRGTPHPASGHLLPRAEKEFILVTRTHG